MIKLWYTHTLLTIPSDRIVEFNSPSSLETTVNYSVTGIPIINGVQHETKFIWDGISVLLTQSELNQLNRLILMTDNLRRSGNSFAIGFINTVFPFTEEAPRTRAIAPDTVENDNEDGSVTYFPKYAVMIKNVKSSILGEWRPTSFDLVELEKVTP